MGRILAAIGIAATAAYGIYLGESLGGRLHELQELPLNNLGDFLAGIFGPLAFLWLVLGFFQQGIELRMQAAELRASVEQQKEMVDVSTGQLKVSRENAELEHRQREASIEPKFSMDYESQGESGGVRYFNLCLSNGGHPITCVIISVQDQAGCRNPFFDHGEKMRFPIRLEKPEKYFRKSVFVTYLNGLEEERKKEFVIDFHRSLDPDWTVTISAPQGTRVDIHPA